MALTSSSVRRRQPEIFDAQDLNSMASLYVLPYVLPPPSLSHAAAGQTSLTHTGSATAILVTRFLLDLQQASRRAMHLPAMNTENWEKVMGSLVLVSLERREDVEEEEEGC